MPQFPTIEKLVKDALDKFDPGSCMEVAASKLPGTFLIDGEAIGDVLYAFVDGSQTLAYKWQKSPKISIISSATLNDKIP